MRFRLVTFIFCLSSWGAFAPLAKAGSVLLTNNAIPANAITTQDLTPIPATTGIIGVGFFDFTAVPGITGDGDLSTTTSISDLDMSFQQFGTPIAFNGAGFGLGGLHESTFNDSTPITGHPFQNQNIYAFAGNGSTYLDSTEISIIKFTQQFPTDPSPGATVVLTEMTIEPMGSAMVLRGTFPGPLVNNGFGDAAAIVMAPIPEPAGAMLVILGAIPFLGRRRLLSR